MMHILLLRPIHAEGRVMSHAVYSNVWYLVFLLASMLSKLLKTLNWLFECTNIHYGTEHASIL